MKKIVSILSVIAMLLTVVSLFGATVKTGVIRPYSLRPPKARIARAIPTIMRKTTLALPKQSKLLT